MSENQVLNGQVAIVTGAAQGIGRGIALVLADAGARIVIGDIQDASDTVQEIQTAGGRAVSMIADISRPHNDEELVNLTLAEYGRLDILVNNAAIDAPDGNIWDLPDEEWERTIAVNLSGVFYCSRAALVPMLKAKSGCIVNISSQSARRGTKGLSPAYNASKAGVLGLTASLAEQVTELGVRVNAILPSLVESRDFGWTPAVRAERAREFPLGLGTPKDVGEAVLYLVSPAARWISGTSLHLTGGTQRGSSVL
jgi:3-oxoacyl-[acyl-carrier protein] reductase